MVEGGINMDKMLKAREYLQKVESYMKIRTQGRLHLVRVTPEGIPVFWECDFEDRNTRAGHIPDDLVFILSNGTLVSRKRKERRDKEIAQVLIMNNEKYNRYYHMRYQSKPIPGHALEALVRYNDAIYIKKKKIYIPKDAGAFTTPISALWRYAVKYSDAFEKYECIDVETKADNPDCHISFS